MRDALLVLATTTDGFTKSFGKEEDVDPIRHLIGTAANYTVRLYRPRPEISNGKWKFPEARPMS